MIIPDRCPKCGRPFEMFYNAGLPVWGCVDCRRRQKLEYSDHTDDNADEDKKDYYYLYYETR